MMGPIKVAVFPVAGLGTRFLPATKVTPKEMFPVVDQPLIQYAVEEAVAAGIEHMIFVTSSKKKVLEDHFDAQHDLLHHLKRHNKEGLLGELESLVSSNITFSYVRQSSALGLGHAVLQAEPLVQRQPFAVLLADDLITGPTPCLQAMCAHYHDHKDCQGVIATQMVPASQVSQYGIVEADDQQRLVRIVEKPSPHETPSRKAVVGRYILPADIFDALRTIEPGSGGEIQLTDAIALLLDQTHFQAFDLVDMVRYDCGSRLGFLEANVQMALARDDMHHAVKAMLQRIEQSIEA